LVAALAPGGDTNTALTVQVLLLPAGPQAPRVGPHLVCGDPRLPLGFKWCQTSCKASSGSINGAGRRALAAWRCV
jgi:hypothetical protein